MNRDQLVEIWEQHVAFEFEMRDADLSVSTMVDDATVMHMPTMSGGAGKENLRRYYAEVFIPGIPEDTTSEPIARSVADGVIVDEFIMGMTHDREIPYLLPGLAPTGKALEIPTLVMVKFRDDLMESERIYWDQATVLSQLGLIEPNLPVANAAAVSEYLRQHA